LEGDRRRLVLAPKPARLLDLVDGREQLLRCSHVTVVAVGAHGKHLAVFVDRRANVVGEIAAHFDGVRRRRLATAEQAHDPPPSVSAQSWSLSNSSNRYASVSSPVMSSSSCAESWRRNVSNRAFVSEPTDIE